MASILVVDDEPSARDIIVERLEKAGYRVTSCGDAAQALVQAEALKPRLVITDIQMPAWGSGVDAYRKFRAHPALSDTPVIFVTGISPNEARRLVPPGDPKVRLVYKPVNWVMLEQAIGELLGEGWSLTPPNKPAW